MPKSEKIAPKSTFPKSQRILNFRNGVHRPCIFVRSLDPIALYLINPDDLSITSELGFSSGSNNGFTCGNRFRLDYFQNTPSLGNILRLLFCFVYSHGEIPQKKGYAINRQVEKIVNF